jgi:two-component system, sensor histidine kinase and response regulator
MATPEPQKLSPILIVDDEKDNLEALARLLRTQFEVTTTVSPLDALKVIQQKLFHVIVSDQRMPEISGVELLEKTKILSPSSVRVLLTGYTDIESVIGAINRGNIYRYVAKPWDPEELKLTLKQADESFRLRREIDIKNEALTKSNRELQKALEDLRLLDRAKARFMSLISHELNTPLTVLMSFVGMLADPKTKLPQEFQKTVAALEGASKRFSEIVSEVLTYVRLESDNELHFQDFPVVKETEQVENSMRTEMDKKKIKFSIVGDRALSFRCDPDKFRVALQKVLEDAVINSPGEGIVEISVKKEKENLIYGVKRAGVPILKGALEPFEPSGERIHHHKDLGLRLAICKLVVESHGGEVEIDSDSVSSTVKLALPLNHAFG